MYPPSAVALDVDGTLVCDGSTTIGVEDLAAIADLAERCNVLVLLVSGRPVSTLWSIAGDLARCDGVAGLDGALAQAEPGNDFLLDRSTSMAACWSIVEDFIAFGGYAGCFSGTRWFAAGPDQWIDRECKGNQSIPVSTSAERLLHVLNTDRVGKVVLRGPPSRLRTAAQVLATLPGGRIAYKDDYLAVLPAVADKLEALCVLLAAHGCEIEKTWAFGDGSADISMISSAGVGIAMGNSPPSVQRVADHLTTPCAASGVARAIEHLVSLADGRGDG